MSEQQSPEILIVGSNEAARRYVSHALARGAFRCTCVTAISDACRVARRASIDAALLDMSSFEDEDAIRLARWLLREVCDLPIVLVGAVSGAAEALRATGLGVVACLRTPVANDELNAAIDRAVRWRREACLGGRAIEKWTREMADRAASLVTACVETGIASPAALEVWVSTLYARDAWTAGHISRVAHFSTLVGRELRLSEPALADLRRASLLHDVGRLAIPDGLLRKAEPLTAGERGLMRTHVEVASRIGSSTPFLRPIADTLLAVRERYAGGGYPRGLRGDQIPIAARVIAVAEAFDALGWSQSREPASIGAANAELVRAGSCFDPTVVRAWFRCVDAGMLTMAPAGHRGTR